MQPQQQKQVQGQARYEYPQIDPVPLQQQQVYVPNYQQNVQHANNFQQPYYLPNSQPPVNPLQGGQSGPPYYNNQQQQSFQPGSSGQSDPYYVKSGQKSNKDKSGWEILEDIPGVFIKQKVEVVEAVFGIEGKNSYKIYGADMYGNKIGRSLFKAKEESGCCMRVCCPGACRSYKIKLKDEENKQTVARSRRDYKCTCFCLNRPEMLVYEGKDETRFMGRIKHEFAWCDVKMKIEDAFGKAIFYLKASCCQLGVCCSCLCCKSCQEAKFHILNEFKQQVAVVQKKTTGCCKACVSDADNFKLVFPKNCDVKAKALLIMGILLLDYQYFEENDLVEDNHS